jgi:hypothetical protein
MNLKIKYFVLIFILSFFSCGTMEKQDRVVRRHDFLNRFFSKTELEASLNWKMGDDILILRKNNTFRYYSKVFGIVNSGYYSGNYKKFNDSISFTFINNHKPSFFIKDTLVFDKIENLNILRNIKKDTFHYSYLIIHEK